MPVTFRNTEANACGLAPGKTYKALKFTPNTPASLREADTAAITQTALDYIEGWYAGDGARMQRALRPDLAKRAAERNEIGAGKLDQMGAMTLVDATRAGLGRTPKEKQQKDVTVLDIFENAATAKIIAADWIDYLHLTRCNGRWQIVNVLWQLKPKVK